MVEALTPFFETADQSEIALRFRNEVFIHRLRFRLGSLRILEGIEVCRILEQNDSWRSEKCGSV